MSDLNVMKTSIEKMSRINQIEVLKILAKHSVKINENKCGIFVNMTFLEPEVIKDIESYLEYVNMQEQTLECIESQKEEFKSAFFE